MGSLISYCEDPDPAIQGWYWVDCPGPGKPTEGDDVGPFKTQVDALQDCLTWHQKQEVT